MKLDYGEKASEIAIYVLLGEVIILMLITCFLIASLTHNKEKLPKQISPFVCYVCYCQEEEENEI
jgi:hypothetical protein